MQRGEIKQFSNSTPERNILDTSRPELKLRGEKFQRIIPISFPNFSRKCGKNNNGLELLLYQIYFQTILNWPQQQNY